MTVKELYDAYEKGGRWALRIATSKGNILAWCNNSYPFEDLHEALKSVEIKGFSVGYESVTITANIEYEKTYHSLQECLNDGFEKVCNGLYAKEELVPNAYSGDVDSRGFIYAQIDNSELFEFFLELANYCNANWKGSFTKEEVERNAERYLADLKWSIENEIIAPTLKTLAAGLAEDVLATPDVAAEQRKYLYRLADELGLIDMDAHDYVESDEWVETFLQLQN